MSTLLELEDMEQDAWDAMRKLRDYARLDADKYQAHYEAKRNHWLSIDVALRAERAVQSRMTPKYPPLPELKPIRNLETQEQYLARVGYKLNRELGS